MDIIIGVSIIVAIYLLYRFNPLLRILAKQTERTGMANSLSWEQNNQEKVKSVISKIDKDFDWSNIQRILS